MEARMDVKLYDEKVRELQSYLPFLEDTIAKLATNPNAADRLNKFRKLHTLIDVTRRGQRHEISIIMKIDKAVKDVKARFEPKVVPPVENVPVKKEVYDASETPDSPSPPRHYERLSSPITIPTERSDDREHKIKREKDYRNDDHRRYRHDHQRSERPVADKYGPRRFDQHERERSNSRDNYRSDRRDRSDSSDRSRHGKTDRNCYRPEDRDNLWKNHRNDRNIKTEHLDRRSPSNQRVSRPNKNLESDFNRATYNRQGSKPSSTVVTNSIDDRFTEDDVSETMSRNRKLFGGDSDEEVSNNIRNLSEVRSKLANQIKIESMRKKEKPSSPFSTVTSSEPSVSELSRMSLKNPPNENSSKFSLSKTVGQSSKAIASVSNELGNTVSIDDDIINKIVAQPNSRTPAIPPIQNMDMIKQALETAANHQRLALKYQPKPRSDRQNIPETSSQAPAQHQPDPTHPNNLQLVCVNDPRLSRARDPRMQQDMRAFSPPSTPPCIPPYPPMLQSSSCYKPSFPNAGMLTGPNQYHHGQQNPYHGTMMSQHHLQSQSNLISITPQTSSYANHRNVRSQQSPVSSSDVSPTPPPPPRYHQFASNSFSDHNVVNSSGMHKKFHPSLNDNVERQKYEQSRNRRSSDHYERETRRDAPQTYGEYKRSLQSNVSSTSEKSDRVTHESRATNVSTSHHDKVYRSGNYATPIPSVVAAKATGSKFKIPKKSTNEPIKSTHTVDMWESKDSEDEQSNIRTVKDSDDSEHEIMSEAADSRDPRMRAQALRRASSLSADNTTKESSEKQNNVVTSSTSTVPENVSTGDNMEFLKHLTNPKNLLTLINLVGQMSDDATFTKLKEVLEEAKESNAPSVTSEEITENSANSMARGKIDVPKTPRKKSKNELEKLNEDIRTMFISDGVLNATGRRVCALYNNNAADAKEASKKPVKRQSKDDVAIQKKSQPENRITRRRNTMVSYTEPSSRTLRPLPRETPAPAKDQQPATPETSKTTKESKTSEPPKKSTPDQKPAAAAAKTTKTKKPHEPIATTTDNDDEPPTKRVTRAQLKECNIVLEKLSPDASVVSLTNAAKSAKKDVVVKRLKKSGGKKSSTNNVLKNIDPKLHSLNKLSDCPLCNNSAKLSMVNHFVTNHPNSEVFVSRLAPDVADKLRNAKTVEVAERCMKEGQNFAVFSHHCHFCNVPKQMTRIFWMNHMAKHTGYYQYRCNDCFRKFAEKNKLHSCKVKNRNNLSKIPQPQFQKDVIKAFICDLCNFVRFYQKDIEKHLRCEHETTNTDQFKEVTFLSLPTRQRKMHAEEGRVAEKHVDGGSSDDADDDDNNDDKVVKPSAKRRKIISDSDETPEKATEKKVLRSRVVHAEAAFIAEPKEDDGLFDKDTMKLMKDMSFSASKDEECVARPKRAKSIAEKLSERFNSVQEDDGNTPMVEEKPTKTEPLDPLTCDEGIPIVQVTSNEDSAAEERKSDAVANVEMAKPSVTVVEQSTRDDNNCTPTDEVVDESDDDNWESYSSDDSENDSASAEVIEESPSTVIQRQPNRKNVRIIDTITRLQQSISSTPRDDNKAAVKDEANSETISVTSEQQPEPSTQSEDEVSNAVKSIAKSIDETKQSDNIKECVSNGRSASSNYSFNFKGTMDSSASQMCNPHNRGGATSSSNADSTNNDVDMMDVNKPLKILTRIDNIGYNRYTADSSVSFCCLIDECGFESVDLTELLYHIEDHSVQWYGYCFTCNDQIETDCVQLMMEFKHMTTAHYHKNDDSEMVDKANTAGGKPAFIKCKLLPGDKLSKLKEEEIAAAQAEKRQQPSSSLSLQIANVQSLTDTMKSLTAIDTKPKPLPMITNVVSLGSASREYKDSELVALKPWGNNQTNKLQKHCKKMLRDICLYALFKCMDINCEFTTDNPDHMLIHLRNHENILSNEPSWLECSYCDIMADSCALLVKHVQDEHQSSIFQCPYCFYRSCSAWNVVIHLKQYHSEEKKSVLVCNGKPRMYAAEKALIEKSRVENIRPLRCTEDCNKITYVMDHFVTHMKTSPAHTDKFKCQFCGFNTAISETSKHLLVHSVGVYECVYCHYGINDVESIQNHMCNTHPSKLLYICVRLTRKDRNLPNEEQFGSVESTLIIHLGQTVDNKLFQRCPFTDEQLSFMEPTVVVSSTQPSILETMLGEPKPSTPKALPTTPIGISIASVTSIPSEAFANTSESTKEPVSGLMLSDVLSYKDLEKDYMHDDWDKYFDTLTPVVPQRIVPKRKSTVTQTRVELPDNRRASTSSTSRTELLQDEIDNAAYILVKGTGLEGKDLYRCSFADCEEQCSDTFMFNLHLLKHTQIEAGFKCYHCNVVSKNIMGLKYHIKVHGIHRYFCYYCNYTSAIENDLQKHMQDTHNRTLVNPIALNPKKMDQNKDMFVMCPRGLRQDELTKFSIALIDRNKRQLTSTKKYYSPDDMESLPRQAIFNSSISCEVCDYSTKVRTNMYRHLAAHKEEKSVPKIDPVNPVPCLDSGEKHFDKMINLACSSNDGKTTTVQCDSTAFIPEARRFVCNARNCQYQNISETMLNRHLTTLHPNEEQYKCPHCNLLICQKMDAAKVTFHLRMHDSKIYKCPKCMFAHHVKSMVEKHKDDAHPGVSDPVLLIVRDGEPTSNVNDGQPKVSKWKCSLCNDLFATQKLIQAHLQTSHSIKFQYQCDICSEVKSNNKTNIQDHINSKHPNQGSRIKSFYAKVECAENDNAPIWKRDDPNKIKHIRGILFEEENVRRTTTGKRDQSEVKKKTSQKKRSDKPVVEQNSDTIDESEQKESSTDDSESNAIVIISDEDTTDVEKSSNGSTTIVKKSTTISNPIPSTSKNLFESGKSFMGSSHRTPIKPSETVVRAEATSSGIKVKKESSLDKAYLCGRCCKYSDNTIALVRAHQAAAHPNVVCEIFKRNTNNETPQSKTTTKLLPDATNTTDNNNTNTTTVVESKPNYLDSINYSCYHCIFKSQYPETVYKHWKENHKFPKVTTNNIKFPSLPFMFRIIRRFQCCYCRRCSDYKDLKIHSMRNHPKETFAIINKLDPKCCATCSIDLGSTDTNHIIDHFRTSHKNDKSSKPEQYLRDDLLDEITSVLPREQVKCTQSNCNIIFFTMAELESHTNEKHAGSGIQSVSVPNDPITYGCTNCAVTLTNESEMVRHIRNHLIQFQCRFCEKRFKHLEMVKVHHEIMHKRQDETYRNIDVNENLHVYSAMKIIFPNGFVLTKADAKQTKYGVMDDILKLVTKLDNDDLEAVRKRQEAKYSLKDVKQLVNKKKNLKRFRISDSDSDDDDDDDNSSPKKSTPRKRLKSNVKRDAVCQSKPELESPSTSDENVPLKSLISRSNTDDKMKKRSSSTSASDDSKPLQRLVPWSNYGKKCERVDLSKFFIDMPLGGAVVKVPCDRFALLFNINPKLRLKRCDHLLTKKLKTSAPK